MLGLSLLGLALSLLGVALSVGACAVAPLESSRVVAIGDVHGGYDALLRVLEGAGISDASGHWIGGTATLVQVGDLIDRGPDDRRVLELIMGLEEEADRSGGRVISLLGNHEVMNLHGDLRYVSRESFASFADDDWQGRVDAAYAEQAKLGWQGETASVGSRQRFDAEHPKGYLEHADAFAPGGAIGTWLRRRKAVVQLGRVAFLHGGVSPDLPVRSWKQINDQIKQELQIFDAARDYLVRRRMILPSADLDQILAATRAELGSDAQDQRAGSQSPRFSGGLRELARVTSQRTALVPGPCHVARRRSGEAGSRAARVLRCQSLCDWTHAAALWGDPQQGRRAVCS